MSRQVFRCAVWAAIAVCSGFILAWAPSVWAGCPQRCIHATCWVLPVPWEEYLCAKYPDEPSCHDANDWYTEDPPVGTVCDKITGTSDLYKCEDCDSDCMVGEKPATATDCESCEYGYPEDYYQCTGGS